MKHIYRCFCCGILSVIGSVMTVSALPTSYYTSSSVLSSGKWVKVKVHESGMQEISYERLRELGFRDPSKVAVYGYDGFGLRDYAFSTAFPDDLPAVPVGRYADKLVFYADASAVLVPYRLNVASSLPRYESKLYRDFNNDYSVYYLTDSRDALEIGVTDALANESEPLLENAQGTFIKDFKEYQPANIGAYLFCRDNFVEKPVQTFDLYLPDYEPDGDGPSIETAVGINAGTARLLWSFPGEDPGVQTAPGNGGDPKYKSYLYGTQLYRWNKLAKRADDIYPMTADASQMTNPVAGYVDYITVVYPRGTNVSGQAQSSLLFPILKTGQRVVLSGGTSTTRVWDVTYDEVPREFSLEDLAGQSGKQAFVSDADYTMTGKICARRFVAFDPAQKLHEVEVVGEVANQNYHGMAVPDMLVISSDKTYSQALRLAEIHKRYTGLDVAVVPFREACNEFSSGALHPMAIRRLVKMLYDREPGKLKAVMLFARAFSDNTGLMSTETREDFEATYVPMLQCVDSSISGETPKCYATDAIYAMLNDNFVFNDGKSSGSFMRGLLDINVGRVPAGSFGEAKDYVDKLETYLSEPSEEPIYNRALILTDNGDKNGHLEQGESVRGIINNASPSTVIDCFHMALYDPYKDVTRVRERLRQQLQRGLGYWVFMGHSAGTVIGGGGLWYNAFDRETKVKYPPFVVYASCATLALDLPGSSIQLDMILNPTGGMIAGVGPTRSVYMELNLYVSQAMTRAFYSAKAGDTMGDVYRMGRNAIMSMGGVADYSMFINTMSYNYAGDPMIPLNVPSLKTEITAFNGAAPGETVSVSPLTENRVEGVVKTPAGEVDESFSGTLTMLVYDAPHTASTALTANENNPEKTITLDETLLQEVKFKVEKGRFAGNVKFALPAYQGNENTITLFAISDDSRRRAVGNLKGVSILQDVDPALAGSAVAPEITAMYAESPEFVDGDCLPSDFTLYAEVAPDECGLLGNSDRLGGGVTVTLDDSRRLTGADGYFTVHPDGSGSLAFPVTGLLDGSHYLTFRAINAAGLTSDRTISFNVANVSEAAMKIEHPHARENVVVDVEHSLADAPVGRLVVTAPDGSTIFSAPEVSFPYTWNLKDNSGSDVPDGNYTVGCYFKSGRRYGSAAPASFVVGR